MKLKAKDTLHISNVKSDPIRPGELFELEQSQARDLIKRGLATEVKAKAKPRNKKAADPANKGAGAPAGGDGQ